MSAEVAVTDVSDDAADTLVASDLPTPGDSAEGDIGADTVAMACSETALARCDYPSRDHAWTLRPGLTVREPETGRDLPIVTRVPNIEGPLPVVVWSHGGAFRTGGEDLSPDWSDVFASHGYVAVHIGHEPLDADAVNSLCTLAAVPTAECAVSSDPDEDDTSGLVAIGRSYDIAAVLDDLPRISRISVESGGPALDLTRVVVAGWSGGARGPMVLMGARVKPSAGAPVFTNPHALPVSAMFMSPSGPGFGGWFQTEDDHSWKDLRGPTFTSTGANDVKENNPELTGPIRRTSFDIGPEDNRRILLYSNLPVGVGGHGTYNLADLMDDDIRLKRFSRALASTARAFLDATTANDASAREWLLSDKARIIAGDAQWSRR